MKTPKKRAAGGKSRQATARMGGIRRQRSPRLVPVISSESRDRKERQGPDSDRISQYFDAIPLLVVTLNSGGKVLYVNRATKEALNLSEDKIVGKDWFDVFVPPSDAGESARWFKAMIASSDRKEGWREHQIRGRSGEVKRVRWHYSILQGDGEGDGEACVCYGLDVEQERLLEDNLRQSEFRYREFFESAPIGIYQAGPDGRILNANSSLRKMLGYASADEFLSLNLDTDCYHPDTPRKALSKFMKKDGEARGLETKWIRKDGSVINVRENVRAVCDRNGTTLYYEGTVEDTTKQRENQEELRYRLNFEHLIASISTRFVNIEARQVDPMIDYVLGEVTGFENVDCCHIYRFGADGKQMEYVNGYGVVRGPNGDGKKDLVSLHPWTLKRLRRGEVVQLSSSSRAVQRRMIADAEYEHTERQGIVSLLCVPFRLHREEAGILLIASSVRDILWTADAVSLLRVICDILGRVLELKSTYAILEQEREQINGLLDNIPDHIYFKDRQSRFTRVNATMAKDFSARSVAEMIGKSDFDFFSDEHARQAYEDEQELMRTGMPLVCKEEKEIWSDGSVTWALTTKMPLKNSRGEIIGTFGISRDITNRHMVEEQRQALEARIQYTQKLESLSILSGTIAHDFNNLLMGILGHTSMALMELTPDSPAWDSIKRIENTALCAAELTNQMVTYSGKSKTSMKPVNLTALVREMASLLEVTVPKKIKLVYHFSDSIPAVDGDSAQLRQVVMNLIINASDAMGDKAGSIVVTTGCVHSNPQSLSNCIIGENVEEGDFAFVEVTDTGCGMDEATKRRIFEPFFTTKATGRGLGLAAVVGIVRSHKGALVLQSEVGRGSAFRVMLPRSSKTASEVSAARPREFGEMTGTVVVVDDDTIVRNITARILSKLGFSAVGAETITAAIAEIKKLGKSLSVVLLDLTMPDSTVSESIAAIKKVAPDVPIILMSGQVLETAASELETESCQAFLQKPFTGEGLAQKVAEVLLAK